MTLKPNINFTELLHEGIEISQWEKIDNGVYNFTLSDIEISQTKISNKQAIKYTGTINNSKGTPQKTQVTDNIDTEDGFKFGVARLSKMLTLHGVSLDEQMTVNTIEELVNFKPILIGKQFRLEFSKKQVSKNGQVIVIKEKAFLL